MLGSDSINAKYKVGKQPPLEIGGRKRGRLLALTQECEHEISIYLFSIFLQSIDPSHHKHPRKQHASSQS
jgi:hypothetical protein